MEKLSVLFDMKIQDKKRINCFCWTCTFVWGLVAHAYGFMQNGFSHDALNAFIATQTEDIWKIELGRIFVIPYRMIFRGNVTIPWLIGVLGLVWTSIAVCLVIQLFETNSLVSILFVAGIISLKTDSSYCLNMFV